MVSKNKRGSELTQRALSATDAERIAFLKDPGVQEVIATIVTQLAFRPVGLGMLFAVNYPVEFKPTIAVVGNDVAADNANFASARAWQASAKDHADKAKNSMDPKVKADENAKAAEAHREAANRYKKAKESYAGASKAEKNDARKADLAKNAQESEAQERGAHNSSADAHNAAGNGYGGLMPPDTENQAKQFGAEADERQAAAEVQPWNK